ncbi:MAG: tetratricopeptide repeat protein [Pseudomonadota bacterium]
MTDQGLHRLLAAAIFLFVSAQEAQADALSSLPGDLAGKLEALATVATDTLDRDARDQLAQARQNVVDTVVQPHPDSEIADAYGELGSLYLVQHVYSAADVCLHNARVLAPDAFRWTYLHAYLATLNGETAAAAERYQQAQALRPDYLAVTLRLADTWRDLNEQDKALEAYRQVADSRGLEAAAAFGLGQIAMLRREHDEAILQFERALTLQPDASRIHYPLAQALRAAGRDEEARKQATQVGDRLPTFTDPLIESLQSLRLGSRSHFSQGMKAIKQRDYTGARDAFALGLAREPDDTEARISYARALYLSGDTAAAKEQLRMAHEQGPDNILAIFLLGILAEEAGETAIALKHYAQVIELDPAHAGANFYLANHHYRSGALAKALPHFAATLAADPENLAAYLAYAGALLQAGHARSEIMAVMSSALQRFPDQLPLRFLRIQMLACNDTGPGCDPGQAVVEADRLAEQSGPARRELLALAHAAAGEFEQAVAEQQALVSDAIWMMPAEISRLREALDAYQAGQIPRPETLFSWRLLQAPRTRPADVFRDYPTPKPY